ncbi:MAG: curli assembly protein CsgF [Bacteroidales bacterium]|nr:curli assembly protein CsgF [Bacteroidales bacterium]
MKKLLISAMFFLAFFQVATRAQDFVYQPINPAFGGNPYNYSWLFSSASAQNDFKEDTDPFGFLDDDPLSGFQDDLNSQVLNEISRQLYFNQFGEDGLTEGFYEFGSYEIDVTITSEGMQIRIIDIMTGSETTVVVPYY